MNQFNNLLQLNQGNNADLVATLVNLLQTATSASTPKTEVTSVKFTKKELSTMPKQFQLTFQYDDKTVKCRFHGGLFHARYRRDGLKIEIAAKTYDIMKTKFIAKLNELLTNPPIEQESTAAPKDVLFSTYGWEWLKIKKQTTKPSTYAEYERSFKVNLEPAFGHLHLSQIDRQMVE